MILKWQRREREGNKKSIPTNREREGNEKKTFPKFGNGKVMKRSILIFRERESEAFIPRNGREREFLLTPVRSLIKNRETEILLS